MFAGAPFALALLVAACGIGPPGTSTPAATSQPPTAPPPATATVAADLVLMIASPDDPSAWHVALTGLATDSGLRLETVDRIPESLTAEVRLLVTMTDPEDAARLALANPTVTVVVLGGSADTPANIVRLIESETAGIQASFLAGYVGALISSNYRVAAVLPDSGPAASELADAFTHGAQYYCGLCRATYPPFAAYPLVVTTAAEPGPNQIAVVQQALEAAGVGTVYLAPPLGQSQLASALLELGLGVVLTSAAADSPADGVVAIIRPAPELALQSFWNDWLAGDSEASYSVPLAIADRNPNRLSDSRLRLVEQVLADLQAGYIQP